VAYQNLSPKPYLSNNGVNYLLQYDPNNGGVQVIQENAPAGTQPIYKDGNWTSFANNTTIVNQEKIAIHNNIQRSVQNAHKAGGGNAKGLRLPLWAASAQQGNLPGSTNVSIPNAANGNSSSGGGITGAFGAILNPNETLKNISVSNENLYGPANERILFKRNDLKYPLDLKFQEQDVLVISQHRYSPPLGQDFLNPNFNEIIQGGFLRRTDVLEESIGTVYFPMPSSIVEAKDAGWGPDNMNNLAGALTNVAMNNTEAGLAAGALGGVLGGIAQKKFGVGNPLSGAKAGIQGAAYTTLAAGVMQQGAQDAQALFGTSLISNIIGMTGYEVPTETILSRGAGIVPNENLELLFTGPSLRTFSISYRLTARSKKEAEIIRLIIRFFKQGMSPKKRRGAAGARSFFLGTPNVFRLKFTTNGGSEIQGVSKFKTCALTSFQTDYTPDGFWSAYESGQPVSTRISMNFAELEPIYDTDYQSDVFPETGLSSVQDSEIGY
jgi:hypothetical protein